MNKTAVLTIPPLRPVHWVGPSKEDLKAMPEDVQREVGRALLMAQQGLKARNAVPMQGFHGASVLDIKDDYDTDTYRCVYTIRFAEAVYVLHAFQKKSAEDSKTSRHDIELIRSRLRDAETDYQLRYGSAPEKTEEAPTDKRRRGKGKRNER